MEINNIDVTINRTVNIDNLKKRLYAMRRGEGIQDMYVGSVAITCEDAVAVIENLTEQVKLQHSKLVKQAEMLNRGNESAEKAIDRCNYKPHIGYTIPYTGEQKVNCEEQFDPCPGEWRYRE